MNVPVTRGACAHECSTQPPAQPHQQATRHLSWCHPIRRHRTLPQRKQVRQLDLLSRFKDRLELKNNSIDLSLFRKPIVTKLAIGIDIALSDTDTVQMSRVFASETIRFYHLNSRYSGFMSDCLRLCTDFLDKGYPPHLLFDGLLKIWRKEAHDFTKFGNQLKNWRGNFPCT